MSAIRIAVLGLVTLALPSMALTQTLDTTRITPGQDVSVRSQNGDSYRGRVLEVSPSSLTVARQSGWGGTTDARTFSVGDVETIKRRDNTADGFFIGLGAGFAAAWGVRQQMCPNDPECGAIVALALGLPITAGSAAMGALIDHLHQATLFDGRRPQRQVSIAPIVARRSAGAQLSMRF